MSWGCQGEAAHPDSDWLLWRLCCVFRGRPRRRNAVSEPASRQRSASEDQRPRRTFVARVIDVSTVSLAEHAWTKTFLQRPANEVSICTRTFLQRTWRIPLSQESWMVEDHDDATPDDTIKQPSSGGRHPRCRKFTKNRRTDHCWQKWV